MEKLRSLLLACCLLLLIGASPESKQASVFTGGGTSLGREESRPEWFGARGDGTTDDTAAVNAAIRSTRGWVRFTPGKTYLFRPATPMTFEGGLVEVAFPMKSGMHLDMTGATLKLVDGFSSDAAPRPYAVFGSTGHLTGINFSGGTLDGNGAHNRISPGRANGEYARFNQAFIIFSTADARGDEVVIDGVTFQNTAGSSAIVMGQCNRIGSMLGKGWLVKNCLFRNNGLDTDDRAGIYAFAEQVTITANTFSNGLHPTFGTDAAIEVHGAATRVTGNRIDNFFQGMWISVNYTNDVRDVIVADNLLTVQQTGIGFERDLPGEKGLYDIHLESNIINLDHSDNRSPQLKAGFSIGAVSSIHDITISGNTVNNPSGLKNRAGHRPSAGIVLQYPRQGERHDRLWLDRNTFKGTSCGLYANLNYGGRYGAVTFNNNTVHDLSPAAGCPTPFGVFVATTTETRFDYLEMKGNTFSDERGGAPSATGIYLSGYQSRILVEGNTYRNMKNNYAEASLSAIRREGREARSIFATVPDASIWEAGEEVYAAVHPELGPPGARYRITGWRRLTSGAGNVLGVDWMELRFPTGH